MAESKRLFQDWWDLDLDLDLEMLSLQSLSQDKVVLLYWLILIEKAKKLLFLRLGLAKK
jgi:hypothetical protein